MSHLKPILSLTVVIALTAFPSLASAEPSDHPISGQGYSSPTALVAIEGGQSHPMSTSGYSSPAAVTGIGEKPATQPISGGEYNSPSSLVGSTPVEPVAVTGSPDSGFDWTDGLLGLVAGLALATTALVATRVLRGRRLATSGA